MSADLFGRTNFDIGTEPSAIESTPAAAVASPGGLSEAEAVSAALRHNAAFQELLAELDLSRADVVQAGLIANPDAQVLFPVGPKQLEATITAPLESLWLRGARLRAASRAAERTAARLTQAALDLIRDVRFAYADLALARARLGLLEESARLRQRVASIAEARVRARDAGGLDAATACVDALRARQEARSIAYEVQVAEERLRAILGAGALRAPLNVGTLPDAAAGARWDVEALVESAVVDRPDAIAAHMGVATARERVALARFEWLGVSFVADANGQGAKGFEAGPGLKFTLPIFNQNQGAIARAEAELGRAMRQQRTLRDRIILEVREAHARLGQAREDFEASRSDIRPAAEEAVRLAEAAYRNGETPLVSVLDITRQLLDARLREALAASSLRRARAELERSVGHRLEAGMATAPATWSAPSTQAVAPQPSETRPLVSRPAERSPSVDRAIEKQEDD